MSQKFSYLFFLLLYFSCNIFLNAQPQNDSLAKYSFKELEKKFYDTRFTDKNLCKLYAEEYLSKAKLDRDKAKISRGYFHMAIFYYVISNKDLRSIQYTDSIIEICKNCNDKDFPALGYYTKGAYLYDSGKNKEAIEALLKALEVLKTNNNVRLEIDTRNAIISIKSNWNSSEETLKYELELLDFIKKQKKYKVDYKIEYTILISNLSAQYGRNKNYKKQLEYAKLGIDEELSVGGVSYYNFVSHAGTAQYYLKNYQIAIDSLKKSLPHGDNHDKAMDNYYLGMSYNKLNQPEKAQFHFLKTDSIYQETKNIFPEMRNAYEYIIDYYKSKNDVENQIKYYDRLIETDKIIDSTYTYVTQTVEKKYETPQAIAERNRLLEEAKANESSWKYNFGIISALLVAILGILVFVFRRQKYYKKRFENLMAENANSKKKPNDISTALNVTNKKKKEIDVPEVTIDNILQGLSKFEDSKGFTKQITLADLAKKLKTNPKYLSKVINWHHQKSYSSYINELRVAYTISKLKEEKTFRNYTIIAIAEEVGFSNAKSFSKAFSKTTDINPSYFIKELNKRLEDS